MDLFIKAFKQNFEAVKKKGVKVVFSGRREPLSDEVYNAIEKLKDFNYKNVYYKSLNIRTGNIFSVVPVIIIIIIGTYGLFKSVLPVIINLIMKNKNILFQQ